MEISPDGLTVSYTVSFKLSKESLRNYRRGSRFNRQSRVRRTFWRANMAGHIIGWLDWQRERDPIFMDGDPDGIFDSPSDDLYAGFEDDPDDEDNDPVGWECIGCMQGFDYPGDCPICGNPLEPYG